MIRASKCKEALANSKAQRRNLEPPVSVGTILNSAVKDYENGAYG